MIACFLVNISAKYNKNLSMLSRIIAKNVGDVFLRHSVMCYTAGIKASNYSTADNMHHGKVGSAVNS